MGLKQYEAVMKAASDPTRVRILKILESGEICVCQIIAVIHLSQPTLETVNTGCLLRGKRGPRHGGKNP